MDRQPRYGVGDLLYGVTAKINKKMMLMFGVHIEKIVEIKHVCNDTWYKTDSLEFVEEKDINRLYIFDTREQAYQAVCKLIDSDIERQLDVIRKIEKE